MLLCVVISNPLLLFPQERAALIETQKLQFQQTSMGILQTNPQAYFATEYPEDFRYHYGELEFLMICLRRPGRGIVFLEETLVLCRAAGIHRTDDIDHKLLGHPPHALLSTGHPAVGLLPECTYAWQG